jgi:transcriptional regulator with XRE-family HTH domain
VTAVNDDTDQAPVDATDRAIIRAVGEELRRARTGAGWSRPELIKRMKTPVPVNTYACYEQGIRGCSIPKLFEICDALGVNVGDLIGLAFQRLKLDLQRSGIRIDLRKVLHDTRDEISVLRRWAQERIKLNATTADSNQSAVVRLQWPVVKEMAIFCGVPENQLLSYLTEFTPESALRS